MRDLATVTLWAQAVDFFEEYIMPAILKTEQKNGFTRYADLPMRREAWNNYTDALCKDGQISDWQYENWSQPDVCDGYGCNS
jgi:hypothetical protein